MSTLQSSLHLISTEEKAKRFIEKYSVVADFEKATQYQKMIAFHHASNAVSDIIGILISPDVYSNDTKAVLDYYREVRDIIWEYRRTLNL
jgi:hypothetical protein